MSLSTWGVVFFSKTRETDEDIRARIRMAQQAFDLP